MSPWPSCLRRWLGSRMHVRAKGPSSKPSYGAYSTTVATMKQWQLMQICLSQNRICETDES